jgi:hypothetical protein
MKFKNKRLKIVKFSIPQSASTSSPVTSSSPLSLDGDKCSNNQEDDGEGGDEAEEEDEDEKKVKKILEKKITIFKLDKVGVKFFDCITYCFSSSINRKQKFVS